MLQSVIVAPFCGGGRVLSGRTLSYCPPFGSIRWGKASLGCSCRLSLFAPLNPLPFMKPLCCFEPAPFACSQNLCKRLGDPSENVRLNASRRTFALFPPLVVVSCAHGDTRRSNCPP